MLSDDPIVLLKREIKNQDIESISYNDLTKKYNVIFVSKKIQKECKMFTYLPTDVRILNDYEELDVSKYYFKVKQLYLSSIKQAYRYMDDNKAYYKIIYQNNTCKYYPDTILSVCHNTLNNKESKNTFTYFKEIAHIIANNSAIPLAISDKYDKIQQIDNESTLGIYLSPKENTVKKLCTIIPIFPFGCNASQYVAVKNALENNLSVIEGPPGTGKTQTILNIIANLLINNKTMQIVSNNNSAIENILEKLTKHNLDFIVASLGKSQNRERFLEEQCSTYPDITSWNIEVNETIFFNEIKNLSLQLQNIFNLQERYARITLEKSNLEVEYEHFKQSYIPSSTKIKLKRSISCDSVLNLWFDIDKRYEQDKQFTLPFKMKSFILYGVTDWKNFNTSNTYLVPKLQNMYYQLKREQLISELDDITSKLNRSKSKEVLDTLTIKSMEFLKYKIYKKYQNKKQRKQCTKESFCKDSKVLLDEYPIILSTTHSSKSNINNSMQYDYLIMDEASQVDICTGVLALSSASNAVIVGDNKQLQNIVDSKSIPEMKKVFNNYTIDTNYDVTINSFLKSITRVVSNVPCTLLKEHYRCHPKIINFCNVKFYNDELVIMTKDDGQSNVLEVTKSVIGNHQRDKMNVREIDIINKEVLPTIGFHNKDIGIIAPYRNQVNEIDERIKLNELTVDTVHKYQGREKDAIILTTVFDNIEYNKFVDAPDLLNVAVSRAKDKLHVVTTGNIQKVESNIQDLIQYIEYNNCKINDSKIHSVFDYLYKQYSKKRQEFQNSYPQKSRYISENLVDKLLSEILQLEEYKDLDYKLHVACRNIIKDTSYLTPKESKYINHHNTHVDFLIYNKITKKNVLAIEVGGYKWHKKGTDQYKRDQIKDEVLGRYRFKPLRLVTNESSEGERIIEALNERI